MFASRAACDDRYCGRGCGLGNRSGPEDRLHFMGFQRHEDIVEPSEDTTIWRYMDLGKYLDMVTTGSLVMPNATFMRDPYEGQVGPFNQQLAIPTELIQDPESAEQARRVLAQARLDLQSYTYLSCWHAAEHESAGMWSLYADEDKGVAVVTTWGRLKETLSTDLNLFGGAVSYLDYETEPLPEDNGLSIYCYKRISFRHEQEVRLVAQNYLGPMVDHGLEHPFEPGNEHPSFEDARRTGVVRVPVELESLIGGVRVSPAAQAWFARMVMEVTTRCGGEWPVVQSDLYQLR